MIRAIDEYDRSWETMNSWDTQWVYVVAQMYVPACAIESSEETVVGARTFQLVKKKTRTQEHTSNHASFGDDWPADKSFCLILSIQEISESTASWDLSRKLRVTVFVMILPARRWGILAIILEMVVDILLIIRYFTPERLSGVLKFLYTCIDGKFYVDASWPGQQNALHDQKELKIRVRMKLYSKHPSHWQYSFD